MTGVTEVSYSAMRTVTPIPATSEAGLDTVTPRSRSRVLGVLEAPVGCITHFGSGSSRRLNHRRDLLLSQGTVRLHHKHGGHLPALAVWLLLLGFNASRFVYWRLRALWRDAGTAHERARHFGLVVRHFARAWPVEGGQSA